MSSNQDAAKEAKRKASREKLIISLQKELNNLSKYNKSDQPSIKKQIEYRLKTIYNTIAKEQQNINNAKYTRYRAGPELYQGGYRKRKTQKRKSRKSRK